MGLTLIIPVYNEEKLLVPNTKKLIEFLDKLKIEYKIIIGSNGSNDNTIKFGKELEKKFKQVKFFSIDERGVGLAFKKAVSMSKYENIISVDMDLSVNLDFIPKAYKLLKNYDIVIGSKKTGKQKRSWIRLLPSNVFIFLTRILLNLKFNDYSIAAKAYKKNILLKYSNRINYGTSYVIDLICFAKLDKKKIIEIPVECFDNRKSRFNLLHEIFYRFKNLVKLWAEVSLKIKPKI